MHESGAEVSGQAGGDDDGEEPEDEDRDRQRYPEFAEDKRTGSLASGIGIGIGRGLESEPQRREHNDDDA